MPGNDHYPPRYVQSTAPLPTVPFWVNIWLLILIVRSCVHDAEIAELRQECAERGP